MRGLVVLAVFVLAGCVAQEPLERSLPASEPPPGQEGTSGLQLPTLFATPGAAVSGGKEPSILADRHGKFIWIADSSRGSWSDDNGTTWHDLGAFKLPGAFVDGWALAQDDEGRLYAAALQGSQTSVARSSNGKSWDTTSYAVALSGVTDRPWMAARGSGATAEVVLFYYDYPVGEYCARSTDAGATWLDRNPLAGPAQGGRAFFDSEGAFYYVSDDATMYKFTNGCGTSRGQAIRLIPDAGVNNMVQGTADGTDLYVAAATSSSKHVTLAGQKATGEKAMLVVSPPELQSNTFVTVAVRGDLAAVAWYGSTSSGDPSGSFSGDWNVYLALVRGFWEETPAVSVLQLTDSPNHRGTICMNGVGCTGGRELLDYFMVDLDIWGGAHVAYVDDASGNGGTYYAHVSPEIAPVLAPPQGAPPIAKFLSRIDGFNLKVDASISQAAAGANLTGFEWSWGDGRTSSGQTAQHNYTKFGVYSVKLTVTDSQGLRSTHAENLIIEGSDAPATTSASPSASPTSGPADLPPADPADPGAKKTAMPVVLAFVALALASVLHRRRA